MNGNFTLAFNVFGFIVTTASFWHFVRKEIPASGLVVWKDVLYNTFSSHLVAIMTFGLSIYFTVLVIKSIFSIARGKAPP